MDLLTRDFEHYCLRASCLALNALTSADVSVASAHLEYEYEGRKAHVGIAERRLGGRLLPASFSLAWFILFLRHRPRWQIAGMLAALVPIAFAASCTRVMLHALIAIHGGFEMTNATPRDISILGGLLSMYLLWVAALWVLNSVLIEESGE